jgi:endoglucanase
VDELTTSPLGSLHGLRKAASAEKQPSLMIAVHMDAVGLMVKSIEHGLLWITRVGGVDPRILPGQLVTVHGTREVPGVVQMIPDRLLDGHASGKPPVFDHLFIDTGLSEKDLPALVKPGDLASFANPPVTLSEGYVAGHSLDNRASVAALTVCLEAIRNFNLAWNVLAVATTQEELNQSGAFTSAYHLKPDLAIVVDVTFAKGPGVSDYRAFPLGEGPSIGTGANNHPNMTNLFKKLAEELDMPHAIEAMPSSSGTDGMVIQVTANGIPVEVLGVAIRNMHTTVEIAAVKDIYRTGRLLAGFITSLKADSLQTLFAEKPQ